MGSSRQKPSVCFVAMNAYSVLSGRKDVNHTGGAEVQQLQMASWLVRQGYSVSFVTLDHGQPDGVDLGGIRVFKAYAKDAGIRGLRFIYPRWSGLWGAMACANADVYYQRTAECQTGQAALWCRLHRRRFIFAAASDADCSASLYGLTCRREKTMYRLGLRLADGVTAQTVTQQRMLRKNMGISACVVRNCGSNPTVSSPPEARAATDANANHVLWVGRISNAKRLEWLLDVAQRCPDMMFDVVGAANTQCDYVSSLIARAATISNVRMYGGVPYSDMPEYYRRCSVLCCTSAYEGFPNTFLEAWSLGIPVVSTFDPDGVIAGNGLGWVAQNVDELVTCLNRVCQSPKLQMEASKAARQYYVAYHTPDACLPEFERLLLDITGDGVGRQGQ
ncbi:MAG: glycosyltransferase family 4 protein [Phycisphaerae bacterium]|nr:glycosyltransferase family 4 protein [Phycisphaerae bacterium]